ncbi:MAG: hypothetical protein J3R72DRAFT_454039, partial [Linnemannia gamsii]
MFIVFHVLLLLILFTLSSILECPCCVFIRGVQTSQKACKTKQQQQAKKRSGNSSSRRRSRRRSEPGWVWQDYFFLSM